MAKQITVSIRFDEKDGAIILTSPKQVRGTFTVGNVKAGDRQLIGGSVETIAVGEVDTPGMSWFRNLDDTNTIIVGHDDGGGGIEPMLQLSPGSISWLEIDEDITLKAQAVAPDAPTTTTHTDTTTTAPEATALLEYAIWQRSE